MSTALLGCLNSDARAELTCLFRRTCCSRLPCRCYSRAQEYFFFPSRCQSPYSKVDIFRVMVNVRSQYEVFVRDPIATCNSLAVLICRVMKA